MSSLPLNQFLERYAPGTKLIIPVDFGRSQTFLDGLKMLEFIPPEVSRAERACDEAWEKNGERYGRFH